MSQPGKRSTAANASATGPPRGRAAAAAMTHQPTHVEDDPDAPPDAQRISLYEPSILLWNRRTRINVQTSCMITSCHGKCFHVGPRRNTISDVSFNRADLSCRQCSRMYLSIPNTASWHLRLADQHTSIEPRRCYYHDIECVDYDGDYLFPTSQYPHRIPSTNYYNDCTAALYKHSVHSAGLLW